MSRILVINPNSSEKMTADIQATVGSCCPQGLEAEVVRMEKSPEVLESFADYTSAAANVLEFLRNLGLDGGTAAQAGFGAGVGPDVCSGFSAAVGSGCASGCANRGNHTERAAFAAPDGCTYDGILLACFGDPGLYALKERAGIPVIGIAEASMSLALLLGFKFSIIAAVAKAKAMMENLVLSYGLSARLASVEALDLGITTFMNQEHLLKEAVLEGGRQAVRQGAEVLLLGCAGMTVLDAEVERELGVPVIDPVKAGVYMLRGIIDGGFPIARNGLYKSGLYQ